MEDILTPENVLMALAVLVIGAAAIAVVRNVAERRAAERAVARYESTKRNLEKAQRDAARRVRDREREQRAAVRRAQQRVRDREKAQRDREKARVAFDALPPYMVTVREECPKCGDPWASKKFYDATPNSIMGNVHAAHVQLVCGGCGFVEATRPADNVSGLEEPPA